MTTQVKVAENQTQDRLWGILCISSARQDIVGGMRTNSFDKKKWLPYANFDWLAEKKPAVSVRQQQN